MTNARFTVGQYSVEGANAELLSVLFRETTFLARHRGRLQPEKVVAALDTRTPHEERVPLAEELCLILSHSTRLGRWLPRHVLLPTLEYENGFYPAYRDHTIHTLSVYLLGYYLYEHCPPMQEAINRHLAGVAPPAIAASEAFHEWWTVAALWHDWGYPFEVVEFVTSQARRTELLQGISAQIRSHALTPMLAQHLGREPSREELRRIYQDGRYVPFDIQNTSDVFSLAHDSELARFFWRIGFDRDKDPIAGLLGLTLEAPVSRPPYYDHGLAGAALLLRWWRDADKFAIELARSDSAVVTRTKREAISSEFVELDGLFVAALEAIAFHNLAFRQWVPAELERILRPGTSVVQPGRTTEQHAFFLCIADTIQDWDRHHFVARGGVAYRPASPSSSMLVQGTNDKIHVSIAGKNGKTAVLKLFEGWLDEPSCKALFADGANFSLPQDLFSTDAVSLQQVDASKRRLEQCIQEVKRVVDDVQRKMLLAPDAAFPQCCNCLQASHQRLQTLKNSMVPGDVESLLEHADHRTYIQLQKVVGGLVRQGTALPRGAISQRLGEGGFGTVYAVHAANGAQVAYKVFHPSEIDNEPKRRLFRRGYDAMHRIGLYEGVVQVYEFTDYPLGFFMELIQGQDLQEAGIGLGDAHVRVRTLERIAETLNFAHSREVFHRDVKPANVIIRSSDGRPVLTDFDLAWISGRSTITNAAYASMKYGAPEQFEPRMYGFQTRPTVDVYSFGGLAQYVLSGIEPSPFYASSSEGTRSAVRDRLTGDLVAASVDAISELVVDCLQADPEKRPPTMGAVVDRIRRVKLVSVDGKRLVRASEFQRECELASGLEFVAAAAVSHTGRVEVRLAVAHGEGETNNVTVGFTLHGTPSYNMVSHDEYRQAVLNRLRSIAEKFARRYQGAKGSAQYTGMNAWVAKLSSIRSTTRDAWALADVLREGIGAIE